MQYQQKHNRLQLEMMCLDQMVAPDSYARVVDAFVDTLDCKQLGFINHTLNPEGNTPYHPSDLFKLYLYGYQNKIRSCRGLAHACKTNIEVMWMIGKLQPHYKTIANFRKDNANAINNAFRHFLLILKSLKLIEGKAFAVDSFKIRAQNSLKNNFNDRKIKRHLEYIDLKIAAYEAALDEDMPLEKKVIIEDKITEQHKKKEKYEQLNKALAATEDGQISTTDPDSRGVVFQRTSVKIGYNIQAASDHKHKLLVAFDTGDVNDTHQLANMTAQAMQNTQSDACTVLADKGYHTGVQLEQCEQMNAIPFVAPKASSASVVYGVFSVDEFQYNKQNDTYTCPANEILTSNGTVYTRKSRKKNAHDITFKHYTTKACKNCTLKQQCTSRNAGRIVQRSQHQDAIDRNNKRIENNPDYYRQRQQIIEHQFGTLKRQWNIDYTLVKTKEKVLTEIALAFIVYNLRRTMSIFSPKELIKALKSMKNAFLNILNTTTATTTHKMKITLSFFTQNDANLKYINYI